MGGQQRRGIQAEFHSPGSPAGGRAYASSSAGQVNPESISYIETHGTGTSLGDPVEIAALTPSVSHAHEEETLLRRRIR
jgi:acyl transferase domain-containing protein